MIVRALAAADDLDGLEPLWGEPLRDVAPDAFVVVRGTAVAGLAVVSLTPGARRIEAAYAAPETPVDDLLRVLAGAFGGERVELSARDAGAELEPAARRAGFELVHRQIAVRGSLAAVRRPAHRPLTFRRYEEVGRRGMLAVLSRIWSDGPGPTGLTPAIELEDFLDRARPPGGRPDTSLWRVAYHGGEPAGAVLALRLADDPCTGALLYIGVLPALRGRGLGGALHAEALWQLRALGVERYQDSTTPDNAAMQRIFERAGCRTVGSSVLLVRPAARARAAAPAPPTRLPLGAHVSLLRKVPMTRG